jgi:hypothetical protein
VQRRAAPEAERQANRLRGGVCVALAQCHARPSEQLLEPQRVDGRVRQRVSVNGSDDRVLPERGAQTGDVVLESVPRCGRQLLSPQGGDQFVHAHDATAAKCEQCEQRVPLAAADVGCMSVGDDLERAEKANLE